MQGTSCLFDKGLTGKGELGYPRSRRSPVCFSLVTCVSKDSVEA